MKRIHKNMVTAGVLLAGGIGVGLYTLKTQVKTPEDRFRDQQNAKRLFHFGRVDVKSGTLFAKNATITFERHEDYGWLLTKPVKWPADVEAIDAALDRMAIIVTDPVLTEAATDKDLAETGLDRPPVRLDVDLKDGRALTLFVGARNKLADRYPVTDGDKKRIGLSEPSFYWALDRGFDALRSKRLVAFDEDAVTGVTSLAPDGSVRYRLQKTDGSWTTEGTELKRIAADAGGALLIAVRVTKRMLAEAFLTDSYDPSDAAQQAKWGLNAPHGTLVIASEGETVRLVVAQHPERPNEVFVVHIEGTGTVAEVKASIEEVLEKDPLELRDRTLHKLDKDLVTKVILSQAGQPDVVATRSGDQWLVSPKDAPAKLWKIDGVLRAFAYLKADKIWATNPSKKDLSEWLLEPPSRKLVFQGADGKPLAALRIGKYAEEGMIFVQADGDDRVGVVPETKIEILPKNIDDLVDQGS